MVDPVALDCQTCGACCAYPWDVEISSGDNVPPKMVTNHPLHGLQMRRRKGWCIALRGMIGEGCRCAIYETRPAVCSAFVPGSADCLLARAKFTWALTSAKEDLATDGGAR